MIELVSPSERCNPQRLTPQSHAKHDAGATRRSAQDARERAPRLTNQRYEDLQAKMQEYLDNGVKLGWLIEPEAKTVEIYRLGK